MRLVLLLCCIVSLATSSTARLRDFFRSLTEFASDQGQTASQSTSDIIIESAVRFANNEGSSLDHLMTALRIVCETDISKCQLDNIAWSAVGQLYDRIQPAQTGGQGMDQGAIPEGDSLLNGDNERLKRNEESQQVHSNVSDEEFQQLLSNVSDEDSQQVQSYGSNGESQQLQSYGSNEELNVESPISECSSLDEESPKTEDDYAKIDESINESDEGSAISECSSLDEESSNAPKLTRPNKRLADMELYRPGKRMAIPPSVDSIPQPVLFPRKSFAMRRQAKAEERDKLVSILTHLSSLPRQVNKPRRLLNYVHYKMAEKGAYAELLNHLELLGGTNEGNVFHFFELAFARLNNPSFVMKDEMLERGYSSREQFLARTSNVLAKLRVICRGVEFVQPESKKAVNKLIGMAEKKDMKGLNNAIALYEIAGFSDSQKRSLFQPVYDLLK